MTLIYFLNNSHLNPFKECGARSGLALGAAAVVCRQWCLLSVVGCRITKHLLPCKVWWRLWLGSYEELELPQEVDVECVAGCTKQSLFPQPCLSLQQNRTSCSKFPKDLMECYVLPCTFRHPCSLVSPQSHIPQCNPTRDNHSCGFEHHT